MCLELQSMGGLTVKEYFKYLRENRQPPKDHFEGRDLRDIGTLAGAFIGLSFKDCDLRGLTLVGRFVECDFTNARTLGVKFGNSTFMNCTGLTK